MVDCHFNSFAILRISSDHLTGENIKHFKSKIYFETITRIMRISMLKLCDRSVIVPNNVNIGRRNRIFLHKNKTEPESVLHETPFI